ncbi:MAG: PAS domain S-box protein, partial [Asgard group archaeon]|nr:PAS domain S-box protein [Asgard group archaeon]
MSDTLNILHLEDNPNDVELVKEMLSLEGIKCTINVVDTEDSFIDALQKKNFNIILADYNLPSFDGLRALELAKQYAPEIPFIFISGVMGEELAIETLKQGATDYVIKSRLERLAPAVKRALREREELLTRRKQEREIAELEKNIQELQSTYNELTKRVRGFLKIEIPSGKYTLVDKFLEDLSGYALEKWEKTPNFIAEIIHPDFKEDYLENIKKMKEEAVVPKLLEYQIIKKDGEKRWWLQFNLGAFDIEGNLTAVSAVIIDNTDNKETEIKYRNLFENALAGIYRTDIKTGEFIEANERVATICGVSSVEELKKYDAYDFYPNKENGRKLINTLQEKGTLEENEMQILRADGTYTWISEYSRLYPDEGYIEGIIIEISERKKAETALKASEEKYRKLFKEIPIGIITFDVNGNVQAINNKALEFYCIDYEKALELNFYTYPPIVKTGINELLKTCIEDNTTISSEITYEAKKDEMITSLYKFIPLNDEKGQVIGAQCTFEDITEQKKAEELIKQKLEFGNVVSLITSRFVKVEDIEQVINQTLADLGKITNSSRVFIYHENKRKGTIHNAYEWNAPGIEPLMEKMQDIPLEPIRIYKDKLRLGEIVKVPNTQKMPQKDRELQKVLLNSGIISTVFAGIKVNGELIGCVGFNDLEKPRDWSDDVIAFLRFFASVLGSAIERKQAENTLRRDRLAFHHIAESAIHATNVDDLCNRILVGLAETLDFNAGTVRLYDPENELLNPVAIYGITDDQKERLGAVSIHDQSHVGARVARNKSAIFAPDVLQNKTLKGFTPRIEEMSIRGLITWPLLSPRKELLGILQLVNRGPKEIPASDKILFETIAGLFASALDHQYSTKALRESEEKFRGFAEQSLIGLTLVKPNGEFVFINDQALEILDTTKEELLIQN